MNELANRLKNSERYKDFTFLEKPIAFKELFANRDFDLVQTHSIQPIGDDDIFGFSGVFAWGNNVLTPLDSDSYSENALVYGYCEFKTEDVDNAIEILID